MDSSNNQNHLRGGSMSLNVRNDSDLNPSHGFNEKTIVHMFLPKQTPDKVEDDLEDIEQDLLIHVAASFQNLVEDGDFDQLNLDPVQVMLDKWIQIQPASFFVKEAASKFCKEVYDIGVGNTIPIYIRAQNCTMLISKFTEKNEEKIRVQTFRASLPSGTVMSNVDSLKMTFPETSNVIENQDMLSSKIFVSHIYEMAMENFELTMGTTEKGGISYSETRDVPQPFLVSDWAVGVLVPREDSTSHSVSKKMRDQVTMTSTNSRESLPFRRSGMWMSIKVAIHLKLLEIFDGDADTTKLVYKLVMLRILVDACESYEKRKDRFDMDLACQMVAKVGRRVHKFQKLSFGTSNDLISSQVKRLRSAVLENALKVLTKINESMQSIWNQEVYPTRKMSQPISRSVEEFKADLMHSIGPLEKILLTAKALIENPEVVGEMDMVRIRQKSESSMQGNKRNRFTTFHAIIRPNAFYGKNQLRIWLHDAEQIIKGIQDEHPYTSQQIFDFGIDYIGKAREEYKDNPLGFSQIMLVTLKLAFILDKIVTTRYPLVSEFKPNIDSSSFDCLLLPYEQDVHLLNELLRIKDPL